MPSAIFTHALNDSRVEVVYSYPSLGPEFAELKQVVFEGVDILDTMHPEDQSYFMDLVIEKAHEYHREESACAAEAKWERDREDQLFA